MGAYQARVVDFANNEHDEFHRFMRMNPETFQELVTRLTPYVRKKTTNMRDPISVEEKVSCTFSQFVLIIFFVFVRSNSHDQNRRFLITTSRAFSCNEEDCLHHVTGDSANQWERMLK